MNINELFPSRYLKASDLRGRRIVVTIAEVVVETVAERDRAVLYMEGKTKGLILNKTNSSTIEEILGTFETDKWAGKQIVLFLEKVDFQGKRVPAIRIDPPENGVAAPIPISDQDDPDDVIPF